MRNFLDRLTLRPLGFAGRLTAIVLLAVFAALALGSAVPFILERREPPREVALPERISAIVMLLEKADGADHAALLEGVNSSDLSIRLAPSRPVPSASGNRLPGVEWMVSQYLSDPGKHDVVAIFESRYRDRPLARFLDSIAPGTTSPLSVAVGLSSDQYVVFTTRGSPGRRMLGVPPGYVIGVLGALLAAISVIAVAREARPLQRLEASVRAFAEDATVRTIPPVGAPDLKRLTGAVNAMQERIATLLRNRSLVLAAISHDMRTFLTRLRLRMEKIPDAKMRGRAEQDVEHMTALLDDTLALATATHGEGERVAFDVTEMLRSDIADRDDANVRMSVPENGEPSMVFADPVSMRRVLNNLIDNGLKYGERVDVSAVPAGDTLRIFFDDAGPGIPVSEREAIFEPFYRVDPSRSPETGGSGLGVAIVRQIIQAAGGETSVEDAPSGGARFVVELPRHAKEAEPGA